MKINLLQNLVDQIELKGTKGAQEFFGVDRQTISHWRSGLTAPANKYLQMALDELLDQQPPEIWDIKDREVIVLMPIYEAMTPYTFFTLWRNFAIYGPQKIGLLIEARTLVQEARNILVDRALKTSAQWFIFWDGDMISPCGSSAIMKRFGLKHWPDNKARRNAITRIMSHDPKYKIVGSLYKDRRGQNKVQIADAFSSPTRNAELLACFEQPEPDHLLETGWVGFGGPVRIHRSVFEEMQKRADQLFPDIKPAREGDWWGYFSTNRQWRGEDVRFCRSAALLGDEYKTYVDLGLLCGHEGRRIYG